MRTFFIASVLSCVFLTLGVAVGFYYFRPMPNPYSDINLANELINKQMELVYYNAQLKLIGPQIDGIVKILELSREQIADLKQMVLESSSVPNLSEKLSGLETQIIEDGKRLEELYESRTVMTDYLKTLRKYIFTVCVKLKIPPDSAEKAVKGELGEAEIRAILIKRGPIDE